MQRTTKSWVLAALVATVIGCNGKKSNEHEPTASADASPVERACANLEKLANEPPARCKAEMPALLKQCPKVSDSILACMAGAATQDAFKACIKPCNDQVIPPIDPKLDTPALAAACTAFGKAIGGGTEGGQEACRRQLGRHAKNCPTSADTFYDCYGKAGADKDAGTKCMLECVQRGLKDKHGG